MKQVRGEKVVLVDDILRSGNKLSQLRALVEANGAEVVGLAVIIYQPTPQRPNFDPIPLYYLAKLDSMYYKDEASCDLCKRGVPLEKVWI
jgi:orotate phosphoribosyltransferase